MFFSTNQLLLVVVFALCCIMMFVIKDDKSKFSRLFFTIVYITLIFVVTFRDNKMADYSSYQQSFEWGTEKETRMEPFFQLVAWVTSSNGISFLWGMFIYSLITVSLRFYTINKFSIMLWGSVVVYLSHLFIAQEMIAMRSGVVAALLPIIIYLKYNKKYWQTVVIIIGATLFHYTAVVFFIIFFINQNKDHRTGYLIAIVFCYILALSGFSLTRYLNLLGGGIHTH